MQAAEQTFLRLPEAICCSLLLTWCDYISIALFDSAICNRHDRSLFLQCISSPVYQTKSNLRFQCDYNFSLSCLKWVSLRGIKPVHAVLEGKFFSKNKMNVTITLKHIATLKLINFRKGLVTETAIITLIDSCLSMTSLSVSNVDSFNDKVVKYMKASILQQLHELELSGCSVQLTKRSVEHLTLQCRQLVSINFNFSENCNITEQDIMSLVLANASSIERLRFPAARITDKMMTLLSINCMKLKVFYANDCKVTLSGVAAVMSRCKALTSLVVHTLDRGIVLFSINERMYSRAKKSVQISGVPNSPAGEDHYTVNHLLLLFTEVTDFDEITITSVGAVAVDAVLLAIARSNAHLKLLALHVPESAFSAVSLRQIVLHCPELATLELKRCNQLSNDDIIELFQIPNNLRAISLERHATLDNNTASKILAGCAHQAKEFSLNLSGCDQVDKSDMQVYLKKVFAVANETKVNLIM